MPKRTNPTDASENQVDDNVERTDRDTPQVDQRQRIAERAYERFQQRGGDPGHDQDDWFEAERELNDRE